MDAELVGAAGNGFQLEERKFVVSAGDFILGLGGLAARIDNESRGMFQTAGDGEVDEGGVELRATFDDGVISFVRFAVLELAAEEGLNLLGFGENDDAGSIAVEAMDEEAVIFERGLGTKVALCHRKEAGGFVNDEDVGVFVDNFQGRESFLDGRKVDEKFDVFRELLVRFLCDLTID